MADTKISDLAAVAAATATQELACNDAGTTKKVTGAQLRTLIQTLLTELTVDNLKLDGNTLSSLNANGNITIDPNGTGTVIIPAALFSKSFIDPHTQADDPVDLQSASSGDVATNASSTGSLSFNLPGAPALGDVFSFAVVAAHNLVVQAQGTQVIKAGATTSTAGGTFTSSTVGSFLRIVYVDTDLWMGLSSGTWVGA